MKNTTVQQEAAYIMLSLLDTLANVLPMCQSFDMDQWTDIMVNDSASLVSEAMAEDFNPDVAAATFTAIGQFMAGATSMDNDL